MSSPAAAENRTWTDVSNRHWQGEFLRVDGSSAVFLVDGKEYPFPLAQLSTTDKLFVFKLRTATPVATAPTPNPTATPAATSEPTVLPLGNARMADAVLEAYNAAFLRRENKDTFYKKTLDNDKRCGTWVGALEIQLAEDAYDRTKSGAHLKLVRDLTDTFLAKEGTDWKGDKWNDDVQWMMIACMRGFHITGNPVLLKTSVTAWNMVYDRGWDTTYDGGIWENMDNVPDGGKCSLSNWPMIISGMLIYQSTRDKAILAKCQAIYAWGRTHLFDAKTGLLYEQIGPKGQTGNDNVYNNGSFLSAANALYQATKEDSYYRDALLAANHVVNKHAVLHHDGRLETAWEDQFMRALARFCRDNNLWSRYRPWFQANAEAAWKARRTDHNITWNDWTKPTATDDCTSFECLSMAVLFQVMPDPNPPSTR